MKNRFAFTMIELIFVIVIMGIIGKFGLEFLAQAYKGFLYTNVNHQLQSKSESAVEIIAKRLQYRIKDSVIARKGALGTSKGKPVALGSASGDDYIILEWVSADNEGFRGSEQNSTSPNWSGIIDLDGSSATLLSSPGTDTSVENDLIKDFSEDNSSTIADAALYFVGSNSDAESDYGWDGNITYMNAQRGAMHPIKDVAGNKAAYTNADGTSNFQGVDIYEYYKLARTAYAVVMEDYNTTTHTGTLKLYYNYQPWKDKNGDGVSDQSVGQYKGPNVKSVTIMDHVSTFKFMSIGSIMKIQVCVKSDILQKDGGDYSLCKEKTIL
jgi:hypothetical protein